MWCYVFKTRSISVKYSGCIAGTLHAHRNGTSPFNSFLRNVREKNIYILEVNLNVNGMKLRVVIWAHRAPGPRALELVFTVTWYAVVSCQRTLPKFSIMYHTVMWLANNFGNCQKICDLRAKNIRNELYISFRMIG